MIDYAEDKTLAELFNLNPDAYCYISVLSLPFSVRVLNRFQQKHIKTVKDLLLVNIAFLMRIPGFGSNSLTEVLSYCEELAKNANRFDFEDELKV